MYKIEFILTTLIFVIPLHAKTKIKNVDIFYKEPYFYDTQHKEPYHKVLYSIFSKDSLPIIIQGKIESELITKLGNEHIGALTFIRCDFVIQTKDSLYVSWFKYNTLGGFNFLVSTSYDKDGALKDPFNFPSIVKKPSNFIFISPNEVIKILSSISCKKNRSIKIDKAYMFYHKKCNIMIWFIYYYQRCNPSNNWKFLYINAHTGEILNVDIIKYGTRYKCD